MQGEAGGPARHRPATGTEKALCPPRPPGSPGPTTGSPGRSSKKARRRPRPPSSANTTSPTPKARPHHSPARPNTTLRLNRPKNASAQPRGPWPVTPCLSYPWQGLGVQGSPDMDRTCQENPFVLRAFPPAKHLPSLPRCLSHEFLARKEDASWLPLSPTATCTASNYESSCPIIKWKGMEAMP